MGRRGDTGTGRGETGRECVSRENERSDCRIPISPSPCLPVSPSPRPPVSVSPRHLVLRLGLKYVKGLSESSGQAIERERKASSFPEF